MVSESPLDTRRSNYVNSWREINPEYLQKSQSTGGCRERLKTKRKQAAGDDGNDHQLNLNLSKIQRDSEGQSEAGLGVPKKA